jgi:hypothetical protein
MIQGLYLLSHCCKFMTNTSQNINPLVCKERNIHVKARTFFVITLLSVYEKRWYEPILDVQNNLYKLFRMRFVIS